MPKILVQIISTLLILFIFQNTFAQFDFEAVKNRVVNEIKTSSVNDEEIETLLKSFLKNRTWPGINYEDVSREGFEHRYHLDNMLTLAQAYNHKNSKYYKSREVKITIEAALSYWTENDFICDNWWHNQLGTPNSLVHLMLLIGDELPEDLVEKTQPIIGRANINAPGARPGGDRIKITGIEAKNMLFIGESEKFEKLVKVIEGEIKYVPWIGAKYGYGFTDFNGGFGNRSENGRGIQFDNSFHHRTDGVNNTLSYGLSYADAFIEWAIYTNGTQYAFSGEKLSKLIDYYLDGICKTAVYGRFPDAGAKNRSVSRSGALRPYNSNSAKRLLKTSDYRKNELQEIVDIREKAIQPTLSHATFFWNSEHFSYQRPNWFASVRMYSTRTHNMEVPYNSEGFLNHHRGDGVNHISVTGDEYYDIWPVYDYQKIPGTTVMQKAELPPANELQKLGLTNFVGAVTNGKYGAVAFDFRSPHDPLIARKAWFFFDDEYVCLGAGISCKVDLPVVTTINQSLLRGEVTAKQKGTTKTLDKNERELENTEWIFHDGLGYVFPNPSKISLKNNVAGGSWWRINKQSDSSKDEIELDVFKLWFDHGTRPSDASYEYIVVPATSLEKLAQNTSKNNIEILSNTAQIQSVKNKALNRAEIVFYKAGEIQITEELKVISATPGIVMLKWEGDKVTEISVADPNRELLKVNLSISAKIENEGENYRAVWDEKAGVTDLLIDLPQGNFAGKSVSIEFVK